MAQAETLSHSGICVHDLKEAQEFYCGVLGAEMKGAVNFYTEDTLNGRSVHQAYALGDYLFAVALALVPFGVYLQMQLLSARQNLTDAARMAGTTDVMLIMSPSFFVWSLAWLGLAVYSGYWLLRLRSAALGSQEIIADIDADFEAETRAE